MMFRGTTGLAMDAKGRLAVPTKHRDALALPSDGQLVLTAHPHRCLLLYPKAAWEPIEAKIMALSSFDKKASSLQRLLVGYADDIEMDGAGRILISPTLRKFAALDKQVVLVGQGSHFELWDEAAWEAQTADAEIDFDGDLPSGLEGFSL